MRSTRDISASPDHPETPWSLSPVYPRRYASRTGQLPAEVLIITDTSGCTVDWTGLASSVLQQSLQSWRWYIHRGPEQDDTVPAELQADPRVRLDATAEEITDCPFICVLDAESRIAPTFIEKCVWALATNPNAAFCNARSMADDTGMVWEYGFEQGAGFLQENYAGATCVFRREAFDIVETASGASPDIWDRWLRLAANGLWGHTLPEVLIRYRRIDRSAPFRSSDEQSATSYRAELHRRYGNLADAFPRSHAPETSVLAPLPEEPPLQNPLAKPSDITRLLILMPWLNVGGAERVNLDLIRWLVGSDQYEVTIATTLSGQHSWAAEFASYTVDIFLLDRILPTTDYARFLVYLIESRQIDVVLISNSYTGYLLLPYLRSRCPHVTFTDLCHSQQESWKSGGYPRCGAAYQEMLDLNITASAYVKRWMVERGAQPDRIEVCYTNIDTEKWRPDPAARRERRSLLGLDEDQTLIVFHGRLSPEKRPILMAQIISQLRELAATSFRCVVIGDGPERGALEQQIARLELESHVQITGRLNDSDLHSYLTAADVLLLPSAVEGISVSTFESMAMGIVPVSADVGGQAELVTPECGFLIPHGPDELAAYVSVLHRLVEDRELCRQMGHLARERVEQHFPLSAFGPRMAALFERATSLHRTDPRQPAPLGLARELAVQAIETLRLERAVDELWVDRDRWRRLAEQGGASWGPARGHAINRLWRALAPLYRWGTRHGLSWLVPLKGHTLAWIRRRGL
jgi:glycosyltransferase involved in cell wall biosynthesis